MKSKSIAIQQSQGGGGGGGGNTFPFCGSERFTFSKIHNLWNDIRFGIQSASRSLLLSSKGSKSSNDGTRKTSFNGFSTKDISSSSSTSSPMPTTIT